MLPLPLVSAAYRTRPLSAAELCAHASLDPIEGEFPWIAQQFRWFAGCSNTDLFAVETPRSEQPVGFYLLRANPGELYLANLVVSSGWRRRGVGSFVLRRLERLARERGSRSIELDVRETDLEAQLLYRKRGYRAVAIRRGMYGAEDAYRMRRVLR